MRFLHVNALGAAERRTLNGRHYLVAPVTMLVPGVLSGSQGPLLYPADEVAKDVQRWNHVPVTLGHPTDGHGRPISGRTAQALEKYQLGFILNTRFDGALRAEAWFDEELVRRKAPTLLDRLRSRTVTELSTGLFTTDQPVANGVHSDGRPYVAVAREYRPDHLAILLDVKGACSAKDGCGVLVNETQGEQTSPARQCTCKDPGSCDECKGTGLDQLVKKKGEKLEEVLNAFLGQPHSSDTGRFKRPNAGTGKADTRDHALLGAMVLTDEDVAIGRASAVEIALQGHNPPSWVKDEARWEKAKEVARKGGYAGDTFWAVVAHVYRNMGGAMKRSAGAKGKGKKGKAKRNALVANYIRKKGDKYCVYSSSGKKLGEYPTREAAEKRLRQIEYFKHKSNQTPTRGEARTMPKFTTRKDAEGHLTANCSCWKGEEKVKALSALPDDAVLEIANNAVEAEESSLVVNSLRGALGLGDGADLSQINTALETAVKANQTDPDDDDDDDKGGTDDDAGDDEMMKKYPKKNQEQTVTLNKQTLLAELGKLSQDEILGLPGMAGIRERDQLAQQILNRGKEEYVDRLTANLSDPKQREARKAHLRKLTLNELQDRLQDLPPVQTQNSTRPAPAVYLGAGPTSFSPSRDDDYRPKPMEFPAINWAEEKKLLDAQQKLRAG